MARLRAAFVEPDGEARRTSILESARARASEVGGTIEADADLAGTLANLVEWPGIVRGSFDPEFLELPEEITTTAMRIHQKYLPVRGKGGLLPHFVAVMDNNEDRKGLIAKGNEWVLNARLADARFFFEEDTRESLESRLPELSRLTFQDRLGDYRQKTERVQELSEDDRARRRPSRSRRGGDHCGPAFEARPHDEDGQGVHGSPGGRRRDLCPPRRLRGRHLESDLRPVPACVRDRRFASRSLRRDSDAGRPVRHARGTFPDRPRPDRLEGPLRPASGGLGRGLGRPLETLAPGLAASRAQSAVSLSPRRSRRSAPMPRSSSSSVSSPSGCVTCSSVEATRSTRFRRSPKSASGTSRTRRSARSPCRKRAGRWISAR